MQVTRISATFFTPHLMSAHFRCVCFSLSFPFWVCFAKNQLKSTPSLSSVCFVGSRLNTRNSPPRHHATSSVSRSAPVFTYPLAVVLDTPTSQRIYIVHICTHICMYRSLGGDRDDDDDDVGGNDEKVYGEDER
ncbi:unnamed protein product [Ceratitis capitata]|uniref:(Mediterranean fruit fly) hypothetical protein n=1 Tax=Ceratitis capitata TaxID=7213 RepID=A0A811UCU5_CERCA|nr:unnamed protein product [Ceratitis capitata]